MAPSVVGIAPARGMVSVLARRRDDKRGVDASGRSVCVRSGERQRAADSEPGTTVPGASGSDRAAECARDRRRPSRARLSALSSPHCQIAVLPTRPELTRRRTPRIGWRRQGSDSVRISMQHDVKLCRGAPELLTLYMMPSRNTSRETRVSLRDDTRIGAPPARMMRESGWSTNRSTLRSGLSR